MAVIPPKSAHPQNKIALRKRIGAIPRGNWVALLAGLSGGIATAFFAVVIPTNSPVYEEVIRNITEPEFWGYIAVITGYVTFFGGIAFSRRFRKAILRASSNIFTGVGRTVEALVGRSSRTQGHFTN